MKKFSQLILILTLIVAPAVISAQPASGSTAPGCYPPPCVPIDGGTTLLIAAGLAIGGKKAYDLRNK